VLVYVFGTISSRHIFLYLTKLMAREDSCHQFEGKVRCFIARSSIPNDNCQLHLKTRENTLSQCFRSTYEDTGQNLYDAQFGYFK
jgi:hypothetical protein